jgi:signal transduction histidine kinase
MLFDKEKIFTSGLAFDPSETELRNKYQMVNVALILSSVGLLYGILINYLREDSHHFIAIESSLFLINLILLLVLRKSKYSIKLVSFAITLLFTFFFLYLIYVSEPSDLRHIWIFTYPIILLYFQSDKIAIIWVMFMVVMLLIAPIQPFYKVSYSMFQVSYLSFVLGIIAIIIYFYKQKMDEAKMMIEKQGKMLIHKVDELTQKDKMLTLQSKQAVMGEMISMIAHQWRQPLSTVTLSISNLQVKRLLGEEINEEEFDKALESISDTVVYLSDTIDDFQTYFRPDKEISSININELVEKSLAFVEPRLKKTEIDIKFFAQNRIVVQTYANEVVQVLLNIINNAVDELIAREIKYPKLTINIFNREKEVAISIADNAGGIKEENLESIFEPYFSTKGKNGTGLGLYMSQMIMQKQFHTKIDVKSTKYGSIFTIVVPKKLA